MIQLIAKKNKLSVLKNETLTSGSLNVYFILFALSEDWDGLKKIICWRILGNIPEEIEGVVTSVDVELEDEGVSVIPFAMTRIPDMEIQVGLYGLDEASGQVVLPTIWTSLGTVREGTEPSGNVEIPNIEGTLTTEQVNMLIEKYLREHPIHYSDTIGHPTSIPISILKEMFK